MSSWFSETNYSNDFLLAYYNWIKQRFMCQSPNSYTISYKGVKQRKIKCFRVSSGTRCSTLQKIQTVLASFLNNSVMCGF